MGDGDATYGVDCLGTAADGSSQQVGDVEVGLAAGRLADAHGLISKLHRERKHQLDLLWPSGQQPMWLPMC